MSTSAEYRVTSNPVYDWDTSDVICGDSLSVDFRVATNPKYNHADTNALVGPASTPSQVAEAGFKVLPTPQLSPSYPVSIKPLTRFVATLARQRVNVISRDDFDFASGEAWKEGATMTVRRATWSTPRVPQVVAIKTLKIGSQRDFVALLQDMLFEIQVMGHTPLCNHRNIMKLIGIAFGDLEAKSGTEHTFRPMLVVPWSDRGTVADICRQPSVPFMLAATITADVADGLEALHLYGIVHADIKPENVLLFTDTTTTIGLVARLSDFGFCTSEQDQVELVRGRTQRWAAPEAYQRERPRLGQMADVFSFGQLAMFLALEGNWVPWENSEETIAELCLRTQQSLYEAQETKIGCDTGHVDLWLHILHCTIVEDPAERLPSHKLGAVRAQLLGVDIYDNEKEEHFRNVIHFRGTRGWINSQDRVKAAASSPPLPWMMNFLRALPMDVKNVLRQDWDQVDLMNLANYGLRPESAMSMHDLSQLAVFGPALDCLEHREGIMRRYPVTMGRGFLASILFNNNDREISALRTHLGIIAKLAFGPLFDMLSGMGILSQPAGMRGLPRRDATFDAVNMPRLWHAATAGDLDAISYIIDDNPQALRTVYQGGTLLHAAAAHDNIPLMSVLLSKNRSAVNWFDSNGLTPMHIAAASTHLDMVKLLLEAPGIDLLANKEAVGTPLRLALTQYTLLSLWLGSGATANRSREIIHRLQNRLPVDKEVEDWPTVAKIMIDVITQIFTSAIGFACQAATYYLFVSRIYRLWPSTSWVSTAVFLAKVALAYIGLSATRSLVKNHATETFGLVAICAVDLLWTLRIMDGSLLLLHFVFCILSERSLATMFFLQEDLARQGRAMHMEDHLDTSQLYITQQMWGLILRILTISYTKLLALPSTAGM